MKKLHFGLVMAELSRIVAVVDLLIMYTNSKHYPDLSNNIPDDEFVVPIIPGKKSTL